MDENSKKLLTASKFKNWLACNYTTINELRKNKSEIKKKERSKTEKIRAQRGDEFEEKIYKELIKKYPKHIKIKKDDHKIEKTIETIKKGYDLIHKAYFKNEDWFGQIDFLIKVEGKKTKLGNFGYEVYDTKLSSLEKTEHIVQLNIYNEWLEKLQGENEKAPDNMWLVLGNKENKKKYKVSDYQLYFKKNKDKYINFLNSDKKKTYPERCQFCNLCDWIDVCEKKWLEVDHLNQIAKIRRDQISKIKQQGIKTLAQFSNLKETEKIKGLNPAVFKTHLSQAKLLMKSKKSKKPEQNILPLKYKRGFNKLPKSSNHDLFFDLEGVDKTLNPEDSATNVEGLEYLFGIYYIDNDKEVYLAYWSENQKEEEENFKKVLKFFNDHLKKYPECHIYHYNHYEKTALKKLMNKYNSNIEQINDLLREAKLVDLYNIVTQGMQVSEKEYSLKNLEKHYGFERIGEIQKANESTDKFLEWDETREKKLVEEIKLYNKEDCKSTKKLQEWLQEKKPKNASYQIPYPEERNDKNWEKEDEKYKKKIDNKKDKDLIIKENLKDVLGFHKREEMVDWQNYFNRVETKNHEDLIEDPECIGNMSFLKK